MNDKCDEWKAAENISYSVYGTPMESTTIQVCKMSYRSVLESFRGVTDKNYITNSYHVHVSEQIDAFEQVEI